ncbi:MAG: hypothetical protein AB7I25_12840 [Vicinamibacterales bacterium]
MRPLLLLAAALLVPALPGATPASAQPQGLPPDARPVAPYDEAYERGFREGVGDARRGRAPRLEELAPPRGLRGGVGRGPGQRPGRGLRRDSPSGVQRNPRRGRQDEVQRGYLDGYRAGFTSERNARVAPAPGRSGWAPRGAAADPAYARGQADGYRRGFDDGHDRHRYDATREGAYRDGDAGYFKDYGSKDAYRRNYRDGFRQGYEDGYRDGTRAPRE